MSEKNPVAESKRKGSFRIRRGGCWYYDAGDARVADRLGSRPGLRDGGFGFRIARTKK